MPIYEYQCHDCGDVFEIIQKRSDPDPVSHECGSSNVHRIMSRSSFVLKGEGWYITDYARKKSDKSGRDKNDSSNRKKSNDDSGSKAESSSKTESSKTDTPKSQAAPAKVKGAA